MGHDSWGALGFGFGVALIIPTTTTTKLPLSQPLSSFKGGRGTRTE